MPYLLTATPSSPTSWVKMDNESVLSGHTGHSEPPTSRLSKSNLNNLNNKGSGHPAPPRTLTNHFPKSNLSVNSFPTLPPLPSMPPNLTSLSNYSLSRTGRTLQNGNYYHLGPRPGLHSPSMVNGHLGHGPDSPYHHTTLSVPLSQGLQPGYDSAQVQMLPYQEDWADNTTVTGMSDLMVPTKPLNTGDQELGWRSSCQRYIGQFLVALLSLLAFLSPIVMVLLPRMSFLGLRTSQLKCEVECDGLLISFSFKLFILAIGTWAVFYRRPRASLPRIHLFRGLITLLLALFLVAFWLFYGVRLMEQRRKLQYTDLVRYASSFLDSLVCLHYLALLLLELRHQGQPQFYIKVVRSPDGESRGLPLGKLSIQRAAAMVLEMYYTNFPIYNPYLDQIPAKKGGRENYKYYDVDGLGNMERGGSRVSSPIYGLAGGLSKKELSHNERFYEEYEYERRLKKRRAKLITATEEAFAHIKRMPGDHMKGPSSPLDSYEAAQSIFPSLARPLQKYLRITRQQPRHTMDSILAHLATSIMYDMAPKAFLEKYIVSSPVLQTEQEQLDIHPWSLVCEVLLSRGIEAGTMFQLRQGEVLLLCEVVALPHYSISEQVMNLAHNKFVIKPNNESPV